MCGTTLMFLHDERNPRTSLAPEKLRTAADELREARVSDLDLPRGEFSVRPETSTFGRAGRSPASRGGARPRIP